MTVLPAEAGNLHGFARVLRRAGFAIAPEQIIAFLRGVRLLGPKSMNDIKYAARSTLAATPDRMQEFETLFHSWFWGEALEVLSGEDGEMSPQDGHGPAIQSRLPAEPQEGGELASAEEQLGKRQFSASSFSFAQFAQALPVALPVRRSFREVRTPVRGRLDLRRSLRAIVGADGDIPRPTLRRRAHVQRKLMLLIDVSGSMKLHTEDHLKLAHAIIHHAHSAEVFTLGTRLTRITSTLRIRDRDTALARAAECVADWDGGTRIGPSLQALLAMPRFAAFARGASVILLSDGLERASHDELSAAMRRLSLRAHRLSLCTPLASDPRFSPQTAALAAILPLLDDLVDGSSAKAVADFVLKLAKPAPSAEIVWRKAL